MKRLTLITMQLKTPGGIERFISTLATMFSKDYQVEIIANYGQSSDSLAFPLPSNIKLTFLSKTQPREISMKHLITALKWRQIPAELRRRRNITKIRNCVFEKYLANLDTDIIITDRAMYSNLVNKYYHGPAKKIATDHNFHQNNQSYINELLKSIDSFDYLVVATDELRDFYKTKTHVKCLSIPNPLSTIPTKKSSLSTNSLISVGRLVPEKDFRTLIKTMFYLKQLNQNFHLYIIGDGREKQQLISETKKYNLEKEITFTGWLPQNKIAEYYYDSSIFVLASKTEAFGLVLAEAMSYGLPCIALSRASGARSIIRLNEKYGLLIQNDDPLVFARNIQKLLNNKTLLRKMQKNIESYVSKEFSQDTIMERWRDILG